MTIKLTNLGFVFVLTCLFLTTSAQSDRFVLPDDNVYKVPEDFAELEIRSLKEYTYFLPDPEKKLHPEDILRPEIHGQFKSDPTLLHHLEVTNGSYWFRIKIIGNQAERQEYALNYPSPYTQINVYELRDGKLALWDQSGFDREAGRTLSRLGNDNVRLELQPGEEKLFYIQCTEGILPFNNTWHVISLAPFEKAYSKQLTVWWYVRLPFIILGTLIVYHLILYINLRRRLYLFMAFLLFGWMINGPDSTIIVYQYFSSLQHFGMSNLEFGVMVWAIMMLGILFFVREILDLKKYLPKWYMLINILVFLVILNFGLSFLNRANDLAGSLYPTYFIGLPLRVLLAVVIAISCLIMALIRWRQGDNSARWFLIAVSVPLLVLVVSFSYDRTNTELLQVFEIKKTLLDNLSFAGIIFFIAFSLSERIKNLDRERIDSQLNRRLALAESERLRELDTVKSRFYTNITHEFRTPLTVIQGVAEQISRHDVEREMIHRNSQQLLDLVDQMLELSKSGAGQLKLNLIHDDVLSFLKYITESVHALARNKKIDLNFYSEEEVLEMDFDPEKILRVINNLLSNAIKFTPEYGKILLTAKAIKANPQTHFIEIKVKDTGIGISSEKNETIFTRFYQVDDSSTRKREGIGIGLALVKELVELMQGQIEVESEIHKGSTFKVLLPINHEVKHKNLGGSRLYVDMKTILPRPASAILEKEHQDSNTPTLLIVEDNRDVMHYIAGCMKDDFNLQFAYDGKQGIDKALEIIPDIVISDIMMPNMDGFDLCTALKQDERTNHIPIILLTAKANIESKLEGLVHGADAYLVKPFNQQELNIRVHKLIELRKKMQQKYAQEVITVDIKPQIEDAFLLKTRQHVLDHMANADFNVETLATALHFSRPHLYRKIKALTGMSTTQFINEIRLKKGKQLILTTKLTISEIAYSIGFNDPAYFTRLFTAYYGKAPSSLREAI